MTLFLFATAGVATAQPRDYRSGFDSKGWTMLGEREVNGRVDRDRIDVGRYEGRFSKLTLVVENSDLELLEFKVTFADRTSFDPRLAHYFKEGQRTRVIDLPPGESIIKSIDIKYRNLPGDRRRAKVQVWGFKTGNVAPPPVRVEWDQRGWTLLGERQVSGRVDRDRIDVGRQEGKFSKLTLVALDSDLELIDFEVKFRRGEPWHPETKHYFREGQRTRVIDLPGDDRTIQYIDFKYRNLPGGGRAKLQVWGFKTVGAAPVAPVRVEWDQRGWVMLGERSIDGKVDRDRITVGRAEGKFSKLTLVALDSDLELLSFEVKFKRGEPWRPELKHFFREGARTRVIDLPGDDRTIQYIDFTYKNLPGDYRRAKLQVWAFKTR
jgi:hypothetical protein